MQSLVDYDSSEESGGSDNEQGVQSTARTTTAIAPGAAAVSTSHGPRVDDSMLDVAAAGKRRRVSVGEESAAEVNDTYGDDGAPPSLAGPSGSSGVTAGDAATKRLLGKRYAAHAMFVRAAAGKPVRATVKSSAAHHAEDDAHAMPPARAELARAELHADRGAQTHDEREQEWEDAALAATGDECEAQGPSEVAAAGSGARLHSDDSATMGTAPAVGSMPDVELTPEQLAYKQQYEAYMAAYYSAAAGMAAAAAAAAAAGSLPPAASAYYGSSSHVSTGPSAAGSGANLGFAAGVRLDKATRRELGLDLVDSATAATNPEYAAALNYAAYGDVTGATGAGGTQVIDIRGADLRPAWDAAALQSTVAAAQHAAKKNAGVATRVWNSTAGSVQQTMEPSRTQKRKHQINALAAHAQAQALELADQRGSANRSRATAYARYGW